MAGYRVYQGNQVEGSGPLGLVLLTYEALYKALARALHAIEAGDLEAEAEHTSRALEALIELSTALDVEQGGEVSSNLNALYSYMIRRISDQMCSSSDEHIKELMSLVQTLRSGWQQLSREKRGSEQQLLNLHTNSHEPLMPLQRQAA